MLAEMPQESLLFRAIVEYGPLGILVVYLIRLLKQTTEAYEKVVQNNTQAMIDTRVAVSGLDARNESLTKIIDMLISRFSSRVEKAA